MYQIEILSHDVNFTTYSEIRSQNIELIDKLKYRNNKLIKINQIKSLSDISR